MCILHHYRRYTPKAFFNTLMRSLYFIYYLFNWYCVCSAVVINLTMSNDIMYILLLGISVNADSYIEYALGILYCITGDTIVNNAIIYKWNAQNWIKHLLIRYIFNIVRCTKEAWILYENAYWRDCWFRQNSNA